MKFIARILFICFSTICTAQGTGQTTEKFTTSSIVGKLTQEGNKSIPLAFANIMVKGTNKGAISDFNGHYTIENIQPGTYDMVFSYLGYKTVTVPNVQVFAHKTTTVNTSLDKDAAALDQVVIEVSTSRALASALLLEQKDAIFMKQSIGAQELSLKGVGNVAEGVTKISGITKQKSKGIVVRGLGERYNFLTVNGLPIITGNPDKKIIPLDKFSTNMVRNINVFKTFNADLYGDFAGASIDIITKDIPKKSTTRIKIGLSGNSQTTFQPFKIDGESSIEALGVSGNQRELPNAYGKQLIELGHVSTPEESKTLFGTGFNVEEYDAPISNSIEITHGNSFDLKENKSVGYYFGFSFGNKYSTIPNASLKSLNTQGGYNSNYEDVEEYSLSTKKSSLISLQFKNGEKFRLKLNNIFIKTTSNFIREQFGYNSEANNDFFARLSRYREIIINQTQLLGEWNIAKNKRHKLKFGTSYGVGFYNEPDRKLLYAEGKGPNAALFISNSSEPNRYYADLDITNSNGYLEYTLGLGDASGFEKDEFAHNLSLGADLNHLKYEYFNRVIRLNVDPTAFPSHVSTIKDIPLNTNNPDGYIFQGFEQGWLNYEDGSDASKFSEIDQLTAGGYFSYNVKLDKWNITLGLRGELFKRTIYYRKSTSSVYSNFLEVENDDQFQLMPALNIKYLLTENANLRFAGSITNTRPRVREILPTRYLAGPYELITGNPALENSTNYNLDVKYEWFPEKGGIFSITGFGKFIDSPIETVITPVAGGSSIGFANTEKAIIYGTELAYQTDFAQIFGNENLEDLQLGINTTLLFSEVSIDKTKDAQRFLTSEERPLQGASPYIINADISYEADFNTTWNSLFTLTYNVFGERIYAVGGSNLDDLYQQPFHRLDFIWKNTFGQFTVDLQIENILNDTFEIKQTPTGINNAEPISVQSYQYGVDFSLSLGYTF